MILIEVVGSFSYYCGYVVLFYLNRFIVYVCVKIIVEVMIWSVRW